MSALSPIAWKNGELHDVHTISPSIASISFHMGTGVFDGMMAYPRKFGHQIFRGEDHFARFRYGAEKMGLKIEWTVDELLDGAKAIISDQPERTCYIRPIAYRGGPELWLTGAESRPTDVAIFCVPLDTTTLNASLTCDISTIMRIPSSAIPVRWKVCGLYANSFLAKSSAEASGFDDGIMLDATGYITEASTANIFLLGQDYLDTPSLDLDVFPGITRLTILDICRVHNIKYREKRIPRADLNEYSGAFLCSTLREIRPISQLANRGLSTNLDPRYQIIVSEFERLTRGGGTEE
jgi:branched-chain amino acid aminotransferase